jgi:hypothetical protein
VRALARKPDALRPAAGLTVTQGDALDEHRRCHGEDRCPPLISVSAAGAYVAHFIAPAKVIQAVRPESSIRYQIRPPPVTSYCQRSAGAPVHVPVPRLPFSRWCRSGKALDRGAVRIASCPVPYPETRILRPLISPVTILT